MSSRKTYMNTKSAARIQSSEAKANSGGALKGGFAARAQRAAARNASLTQGGAARKGGGGGRSGKPLLKILILFGTITVCKYLPWPTIWDTLRQTVIQFYIGATSFVAEGGISQTCKKAEDLLKKAAQITFEKVEDRLKATKNLLPAEDL